MPNDIYPDLTNSSFDVRYAKRKVLTSDMFNNVQANNTTNITQRIIELPFDPVIDGIDSTLAVEQAFRDDRTMDLNGFDFNIVGVPEVETDYVLYYDPVTGRLSYGPRPTGGDSGSGINTERFAAPGEDDTATEERSFDITGAYSFKFTNATDELFEIVGSSGQLVFGKYGIGSFENTPEWVLGVDAVGNVIEVDPSSFAVSGADPTASIGLAAVNGVATTFMRSDAAPPLNQSIAPTWTGIHTFNNKVLMFDGRFEYDKGANVAAANDLTLGTDGNLFTITGNTQINAITTANWQAGSQIAFIFTGTPTLKNNTAGGAGTASLLLAGRVDYVAAAGDYIAFQYDGTNWYETNRKLAATGGVYTFNNGLTESPAGTVKLGGTLVQNTTVIDAGFTMTFSNNTATQALIGANSSNGVGVNGTSGSGNGVQGSSTSGNGVVGLSFGSAAGVSGTSTSGAGGIFTSSPSSTNTVVDAVRLQRTTSGTPANGLGAALDFTLQSSSGNFSANKVISKWTDVTVGTRTSQFIITGVNNGTTGDKLTIDGLGWMKLNGITATAAGALTAADGMIVYVTTTDATFTVIGYWARENGAWVKW